MSQLKFVIFLFICMAETASSKEILFEAYFRTEKEGKPFGYSIQQLSQNQSDKSKTLLTYVRALSRGKEVYRFYRSTAKAGSGSPIQTLYQSNYPGVTVQVAASFRNGNGRSTTRLINQRSPANAKPLAKILFADSFLYYLADFSKIKRDRAYHYRTYAVELGDPSFGVIDLIDETTAPSGTRVLHVVNDYLGFPMESFIAPTGEPLASRNPGEKFVSYWVKNKEEAVGSFQFPKEEIRKLFGDLPEGKKNPWNKMPYFDAGEVVATFKRSLGAKHAKKKTLMSTPLPMRTL